MYHCKVKKLKLRNRLQLQSVQHKSNLILLKINLIFSQTQQLS